MNHIPRDPKKDFEALLDIGYQESAIETISDWASCRDVDYQEAWAKTIRDLLVEPLYWWIAQQKEGKHRRIDVAAGEELATYAWMDIGYGFSQRQQLYPEHVSKLDSLWKEFQRVVGAGAVAHEEMKRSKTSRAQSERARKKRKELPSKTDLTDFRETHYAKRGTDWGWRSKACRKFGISDKTLKKIVPE
ncbi:MAG: hypothetical protein K8F56_12190 [Rhodocyclaceae bacterium]|nr:hypothetical protein [Rhodocyclaceae bacterium]